MPLIAQADFISQTAIVAGAINDPFSNNETKKIVLSLDNDAKFVSATATWKLDNTDISIPITSVDDDGNLIIDGIQSNEATSLGVLTTVMGADFPALKIATVVDSDVEIKNASGTIPKFKPDNMGYIRDIIITENVAGAIATERAANALTMTLPSDWIFVNATNATTAPFSGHGTHTAIPAQTGWTSSAATGNGPNKEGNTEIDNCSFTDFTNPSTKSILYKVPKNASKGKYFATITVKLVNGEVKTQKLKIAEVAPHGINATVVDFKTDKFDLEPVQDTTIPEYPKGLLDATLDAIMIVENYGDDLTTGDSLTLTLPTDVVFSTDWLAAAQEESDVAGGGKTQTLLKDPISFCTKEAYETPVNAGKQFCSNIFISRL